MDENLQKLKDRGLGICVHLNHMACCPGLEQRSSHKQLRQLWTIKTKVSPTCPLNSFILHCGSWAMVNLSPLVNTEFTLKAQTSTISLMMLMKAGMKCRVSAKGIANRINKICIHVDRHANAWSTTVSSLCSKANFLPLTVPQHLAARLTSPGCCRTRGMHRAGNVTAPPTPVGS